MSATTALEQSRCPTVAQTAAKRTIRTGLPFARQPKKKYRIFSEPGMRNGNKPTDCLLWYPRRAVLFLSQTIYRSPNMLCELSEFSPHGISLYFSFSRISSAVMPDASSFFSTASASTFLAASAAFASAAAFLASSFAIFFSVCLISAF